MVYVKGRSGQSKVYLGSRRRIRRLTMRQNWPRDSWLLAILVLVMLLVAAWVSRNLPADRHHDSGTSLGAAKER